MGSVISKNITIAQLASVMKELGAWHALNLDGGSSTSMAYEGKEITGPSRKVPCFLLVFNGAGTTALPTCPDIRKYLQRRAAIRARSRYLNAYSLYDARSFTEALEEVLKSCELDEDNITYFEMAARCYGYLGKSREAAGMHTRCAFLMLRRGEKAGAKRHIDAALNACPGYDGALDAQNLVDNDPEIASAFLDLLSGKSAKALSTLEQLRDRWAQNPVLATFLGEAYRSVGESRKAAACYRIAGEMYLKRESLFGGFLSAKQAVELDPENREYRELLSRAARARGDRTTAALQQSFCL